MSTPIIAMLLAQQPPNIWQDPNAIGLIGIGVGIAAIIIGAIVTIAASIYQVRQARTKRKLEYQIISNAPIVTVNKAVTGRGNIEILLDGKPIKNARMVILQIKNTGNTSIKKDDYFEQIKFEFSSKIINADILETEPANLIPPEDIKNFLTLDSQSIELPPISLNRQDSITISTILEGKTIMNVRGRLDQGIVAELQPPKRLSPLFSLGIGMLTTLILWLIGSAVLQWLARILHR